MKFALLETVVLNRDLPAQGLRAGGPSTAR